MVRHSPRTFSFFPPKVHAPHSSYVITADIDPPACTTEGADPACCYQSVKLVVRYPASALFGINDTDHLCLPPICRQRMLTCSNVNIHVRSDSLLNLHYLTTTFVTRLLAASVLGIFTSRTPSLKVVLALSVWTCAGIRSVRLKEPCERSSR